MEEFRLRIKGVEIIVVVMRKNVKNINLTVKESGEVIASAPWSYTVDEIREFLESKAMWMYGVGYNYQVKAGKINNKFSIVYNKREIEYEIIRKNIKSLNLKVNKGFVIVTAPFVVEDQIIKTYVKENIKLVYDSIINYEKFIESNICKVDCGFETGDTVYFIGEKYYIEVKESESDYCDIDCTEKKITINTRNVYNCEVKIKIYVDLQKKFAKKYFRVILDSLYVSSKPLGFSYPVLSVRKMKKYWSTSNSETNRMTINTDLIERPINQIQFVILGELINLMCIDSLIEYNKMFKKLMPNYEERKKMLGKRQL